jgi:hypothetical protein
MKKTTILCFVIICLLHYYSSAQDNHDKHPNTSGAGWVDLFKADLSNAVLKGVWTVMA